MQTIFSAIDHVLGNEHTTNPPIIVAPIANVPIIEASGSPRATTPAQSEVEDASPDAFSSGKRVKKKSDKSEAILELMVQGLEIKKKGQGMLMRAEMGY